MATSRNQQPPRLQVGILSHSSHATHDIYDILVLGWWIRTTVTSCPWIVERWIHDIEYIHRCRLHKLVVGLDAKWRPDFTDRHHYPVATLQLCVGSKCLIFQLIYARFIPNSLRDFLKNENYTFVGVGIGIDVDKLERFYDLNVKNFCDLEETFARLLGNWGLTNVGLERLALFVLGKPFVRPWWIALSRWDNRWLRPTQVLYATVGASISFHIGRVLSHVADDYGL